MKSKLLSAIVLLIVALASCKKNGSNITSGNITGKWKLVSDSTFEGVGTSNHPVIYTGEFGDYFNFATDGHVYTSEGPVLDTLNYRTIDNTSFIISGFGATLNGVPDTCKISGSNSRALVIRTHLVFTPGGIFGRTVHLSR